MKFARKHGIVWENVNKSTSSNILRTSRKVAHAVIAFPLLEMPNTLLNDLKSMHVGVVLGVRVRGFYGLTMKFDTQGIDVVPAGTTTTVEALQQIGRDYEERHEGATAVLQRTEMFSIGWERTPKIVLLDDNDMVVGYHFFMEQGYGSEQVFILDLVKVTREAAMKIYLQLFGALPADERDYVDSRKIIKLGGDPEFELWKNGELQSASDCGFNSCSAEIGCDGASATLEMRPRPGNAQGLYDNFVGLLAQFANTAGRRGYYMSSRGDHRAIGGHVHFNVPVNKIFVRILDWVCAPVVSIESGGARSSYCRLGLCREQPHGFEYRSLPSAMWGAPKKLQAWLTTLHLLAKKFYNKQGLDTPLRFWRGLWGNTTERRFSDWDYLMGSREGREDFQLIVKFLLKNGVPLTTIRDMYQVHDYDDVVRNFGIPITPQETRPAETVCAQKRSIFSVDGTFNITARNILMDVPENVRLIGGLHQDRGNNLFFLTDEWTDRANNMPASILMVVNFDADTGAVARYALTNSWVAQNPETPEERTCFIGLFGDEQQLLLDNEEHAVSTMQHVCVPQLRRPAALYISHNLRHPACRADILTLQAIIQHVRNFYR